MFDDIITKFKTKLDDWKKTFKPTVAVDTSTANSTPSILPEKKIETQENDPIQLRQLQFPVEKPLQAPLQNEIKPAIQSVGTEAKIPAREDVKFKIAAKKQEQLNPEVKAKIDMKRFGDLANDEVVQRLSNFTAGEASYYNPTNPDETRPGTDGTGAYGRKIERGSVAFGNRYFQEELKKGKNIYVQVEGFEDVKTPYGDGIFRIDDTMNKRYNKKGQFNIDFHPDDFGEERISKGRFPINFKIVKIE